MNNIIYALLFVPLLAHGQCDKKLELDFVQDSGHELIDRVERLPNDVRDMLFATIGTENIVNYGEDYLKTDVIPPGKKILLGTNIRFRSFQKTLQRSPLRVVELLTGADCYWFSARTSDQYANIRLIGTSVVRRTLKLISKLDGSAPRTLRNGSRHSRRRPRRAMQRHSCNFITPNAHASDVYLDQA